MKKEQAVITTNQGQENSVMVEVIYLSVKAKVVRSLQLFFLLLVFAGVSVFIPVLHFVLVPLFLLLAIYLPIQNITKDKALAAQSIACPKCRNPVVFKAKTFKNDVKNVCFSCQSQIKVRLKKNRMNP